MKSYYEVLDQHYYEVLKKGNVLHDDGNGWYLKLELWPTDICACPTAAHIESLR
mgnify:FL=1|tara:strand:- start:79 stop:240 length:162 start_codon:yes stop_codon:yes gene_type:complete